MYRRCTILHLTATIPDSYIFVPVISLGLILKIDLAIIFSLIKDLISSVSLGEGRRLTLIACIRA